MYDVVHNWFIEDTDAMTCGLYPSQTRPESCDADFNALVGLLVQTEDFNINPEAGAFIESDQWRQVLTGGNPSYFTEGNPGTFFGLTNEALCGDGEDSCDTRDALLTLI
jgi:hypothetical protein